MKAWIVTSNRDFWIEIESTGNEQPLKALAAAGWLPESHISKPGKMSRTLLVRTVQAFRSDGYKAGIRKAKLALQRAGFMNIEQLDRKEMLDRYC